MAATALLRTIARLRAGTATSSMPGPAHTCRTTAASRVILIGTGTSQHAAELGAMMLSQAGRDACWHPAVTWARWSPGRAPGMWWW